MLDQNLALICRQRRVDTGVEQGVIELAVGVDNDADRRGISKRFVTRMRRDSPCVIRLESEMRADQYQQFDGCHVDSLRCAVKGGSDQRCEHLKRVVSGRTARQVDLRPFAAGMESDLDL